MARALSEVNPPAISALVAEAQQIADGVDDDDSYAQGEAAGAMAKVWVGLGRWGLAERLVRGLADRDDRDGARLGLVEALHAAGELDRAERIARGMDDAERKVRAMAVVLGAVVELDPDRAGDLAVEAEQLAEAIEEPFGQARAYLEIVGSLTAASPVQHAGPDDPLRARAHRLLGVVLAGPSWSDALTPLARLHPLALEAVGRALQEVTPA